MIDAKERANLATQDRATEMLKLGEQDSYLSVAHRSSEIIAALPIKIDENRCSKCLICYRACPLQAISINEENMPRIELEKCMSCGVCATACPSNIIEPYPYASDGLLQKLETQKEQGLGKKLVIMCSGIGSVTDVQKAHELMDLPFILVPCLTRLPVEFYLKVISLGVEQILIIQCTGESCPLGKASNINKVRIAVLKSLLKQFGYGDDTIQLWEIAQPQDACVIDMMTRVLEFAQDLSCGKCVLCRWGTRQMLDILRDIAGDRGRSGDVELLQELAQSVEDSALCGLGKNIAKQVLGSINCIRDKYDACKEHCGVMQ
jgi:ferredoxin